MSLPTQRQLAKQLRLSQACISKALRGLPGISDATRDRVLAAAAALGYQADPVLSALVSRRRGLPAGAAIAYIRQPAAATLSYADPYYAVVSSRCRAIGLPLWMIEALEDPEVMQRELDRRRVAGVIIGQSLTTRLELSWDRIRAVHCGLMVPPERGDVVCPDISSAVATAWEAMTARGYERIAGVAYTSAVDSHSERMLAGALLDLERRVADPRRFRTWIGPRTARAAADAAAAIRRQRPAATLLYWGDMARELAAHGIDLPYAALAANPGFAGMRIPFEEIAEAAVDLMVQRLREAPGHPRSRRIHLIGMRWHDGPTLPVRGDAGSIPATTSARREARRPDARPRRDILP